MQVAIVTFDGFNEIDSIVAAHIINRVPGWRAEITTPGPVVTSMNGVAISSQRSLEFTAEADAVVIGSGRRTREFVADDSLMSRIRLDANRQLIASQCSGVLVLIRLGLLQQAAVCTDAKTHPYVVAEGCRVLDQPFDASGAGGRIATAGGCLASHYLATWLIWKGAGERAAVDALSYVLPRGEEEAYTSRALRTVAPFIEVAGENARGTGT